MNIEKSFSALSSLYNYGQKIMEQPDCCHDSNVTTSGFLFGKFDIEEVEKNAQKLIDDDVDLPCYFISPLCVNKIFSDETTYDEEDYWKENKESLGKIIEKDTGFIYGVDFVILNRGYFQLVVFLTKDNDGIWCVPGKINSYFIPDGSDDIQQLIDSAYLNTDIKYLTVSAIVLKDENSICFDINVDKLISENKVYLKTVYIDLSFLRTISFAEYDIDEGKSHKTFEVFKEAIVSSTSIENRIISFNQNKIEDMIKPMIIPFSKIQK